MDSVGHIRFSNLIEIAGFQRSSRQIAGGPWPAYSGLRPWMTLMSMAMIARMSKMWM
jgi:hypothetical protein